MRHLHTLLPRIWLSRGVLAWVLWSVSLIYGAMVHLRRWAFQKGWLASGHPPAVVVVVGNVVVGGAGKTPMTIALVRHLNTLGLKAGVVSRGHGRKTQDICQVVPGTLAQEVGDEPLLIQRQTGAPVWVGASRLETARQLLRSHPDVQVIVCDDGLQHLALQRGLEICLMDDRGTGNGWLLPAGPLREPWPRPVDLLLNTHGQANLDGFVAQRRLMPEAVNAAGERRSLTELAAQPVSAVAGLARPQAFFDMLRAQGLTLAQTVALPDHHDFADWDKNALPSPLLCTEKDAVKLWAHQPNAWAVPMTLEPEPAFWQALDDKLRQLGLAVHVTTRPVSSVHGQ